MENRAKKSKNAQSKNRKREQIQGKETGTNFKTDAVQLIYNCDCEIFPNLTVNEKKNTICIYMSHKCPSCKMGCLQQLVIGNTSRETNGVCAEPGCNCQHVIREMPLQDFFALLREI